MNSTRKKQSVFSISYDPMYQFSDLNSPRKSSNPCEGGSSTGHNAHFHYRAKKSGNQQFRWKSKGHGNSKKMSHVTLEPNNHPSHHSHEKHKHTDPMKVPTRTNSSVRHSRQSLFNRKSRRTKKAQPEYSQLKIDLEILKRHEAAKVIQRAWRKYRKIKYHEEGKCLRHGDTKARRANRLMRRFKHSKLYKIAKEPWIQNNHHKVYMKTHQCTC
ncbi:hypothetical protein K493DRAFT_333359 [Basidiobolus meristosporus CBS 931.73]|uniref:Uncharacterized protein n=1 Tax=Basidiobolus meristosporus CBS 931.73 TaxID=1314790 RepID=A0A1Y1Z6C8_9FUNG|nr:hypothetical protein K493DRAFT_333359 [Basidiobolus meristosporus CBS 931.73]|eukprot:ORY05852.1 hypothetical protein K493DRAFT_333359 [Basidiobolus meristosporus CBS 931.73]